MKRTVSNKILALAILVAFALSAAPALASSPLYKGSPAKYVFFFIGDGMGIPQRAAASAFMNKKLLIDSFPAQGLTTTFAADRFITDSAASATALASGCKTDCGVIGLDAQFKQVKTVAELAKERGQKVAIISSVSIDHATPAAYYAHVKSRNFYHYIDHALAESNFDFFGGGGLKDIKGKRKGVEPKGNALDKAKANGYKVVTNKKDFMALKPGAGKVLSWNQWLQDSGAMPYSMDQTDKDISLAQFTAKAIELLDNEKGFFMMIEGGKIDWACHANDGAAAIHNTIAFDQAVAEAVKFMQKHPKETAIIVTGDHECGGLTLGFAGTKYDSNFNILASQKVSFTKFDQEIIKEFKKMPASKVKFDNMMPLITKSFGLKFEGDSEKDKMVLKSHEAAMLRHAFMRTMSGETETSDDPTTSLLYGGYEPLTVQITHLLNNKAGLGWTSYAHTGTPVTTSAIGVGSVTFNGYYDNTDLAKKTMAVMGLSPKVFYAATPLKLAAQ